jgi:nucleotide-binding universal stress UspA family protein
MHDEAAKETPMGQILVGVDGSRESQEAVRQAEHLARTTNSDLVIACAAGTPSASTSPDTAGMADLEVEEARDHAAAVVNAACGLVSPGLFVETIVMDGDAATALSHLAANPRVDFVVVGHRSRGTVARALLGSVADRLTQTSPKPVVVVRSPRSIEPARDPQVFRTGAP